MSLNKCPECGSEAEFDWSGTTEMYGRAYQTASVDCTNNNCFISVDIEIETSGLKSSNAAQLAKQTWNSLITLK